MIDNNWLHFVITNTYKYLWKCQLIIRKPKRTFRRIIILNFTTVTLFSGKQGLHNNNAFWRHNNICRATVVPWNQSLFHLHITDKFGKLLPVATSFHIPLAVAYSESIYLHYVYQHVFSLLLPS